MISGVQRIYMANMLTSGSVKDREHFLSVLMKGEMHTLETYWKTNAVKKLLDENPKLVIFLDSGAHSLLNVHARNQAEEEGQEKSDHIEVDLDDFYELDTNTRVFHSAKKFWMQHTKVTKFAGMKSGASKLMKSFDFADKKEVKDYLNTYIEFCHKYKTQCDPYVNLDIIFNPEKTWENQKYMESHGLQPLPVFHFGEDFKWLDKYVDNYPYIGISGLGSDIQKKSYFQSFGDKVFKRLSQSKQMIKVHGFAATSFDLIKRYPWYSIDSTTWIKHAAYGSVMVPPYENATGNFLYAAIPTIVRVSSRINVKQTRTKKGGSFRDTFTGKELETILHYFEVAGVEEGKLSESLFERCKANLHYYKQLQRIGVQVDEDVYLNSSKSFF